MWERDSPEERRFAASKALPVASGIFLLRLVAEGVLFQIAWGVQFDVALDD